MNDYKIYGENFEKEALNQFYSTMEQNYVVRGALMPDAHVGYSLPIGSVIATKDMIVPSWVGYDIGCGVCAVKTVYLKQDIIDRREEIFNQIYRDIPTGFKNNKRQTRWDNYDKLDKTPVLEKIFEERGGFKQLSTLGGGNHFIELSYDESNMIWIVIHSGSRNVGHSVATHYMKVASNSDKAKEGHFPLGISSVEGQNYFKDMLFCLEFALQNRIEMIKRITMSINRILGMVNVENKSIIGEIINRTHNHINVKNDLIIHRKGATHAEKGMMGVIPGNMRDGSFIVEGLGNPDSLFSSSHGAGRVMSRTKAKKQVILSDFEETMKGVTAKVKQSTIDESPFAYKDILEVMKFQNELVKIKYHLKPIINVKG